MQQSGLLEKLCLILMASGIPADILTEVLFKSWKYESNLSEMTLF